MQLKEANKIFEEFDVIGEFPWTRKRICVTLAKRTIEQLKKISKEKNIPVSHLIDSLVKP